ncbi:cysteine desulfurase family protein [Bhargavaea massiliensis]|uniref:cysteine desulfurase family protein n=1 Tax=Bhargavaea massiliensis TaxID=2697500 RepID=UPI001BCBA1BC|nr:cysteine desulfurase family protein [Bhargavaea massiliensis]
MVYLDNSATTKMYEEVYEAMLPFLLREYGNPSSKYYAQANTSKKAVEESRLQLSSLLGTSTDEIIFTSGSTESNNMIIKGVADFYSEKGNHIITSVAEHPSVLETCEFLESKGYRVTYLETDRYGRVDPKSVEQEICQDTILVTIMWGNNELGSLNNIEAISNICLQSGTFFHTDATQVVGKLDFSLEDYPGISFMSCSAHKFHGPKGIGAVYIKKDQYGIPTPITPLLHGGGQEKEIRSGTLAVHNIVGMGKAAKVTEQNLKNNIRRLIENEEYLTGLLNNKFGDAISFNSDIKDKIPGILNVQFKGINNELLLKQLAPYVAASTGSACSSSKPSHVLAAAGYSHEEIRSSIRFSMSSMTTKEELTVFNEL